MTASHTYLADGSYSDVRWFVERPPDLAAPAVVLTLQCWGHDGRGELVTERIELPKATRAIVLDRIDQLLTRLETKAAKRRAAA